MYLNFSGVGDLLFPPSSDELLVRNVSAEDFRSKFSIRPIRYNIQALSSFKDAQIRAAIHLVKFHNHRHAALLLSSLLINFFEKLPPKEYLIIPVPLSGNRMRKRGHNQVSTVASLAMENFPHLHLHERVLKRSVNTKPQATLSKIERKTNVKDAFCLSSLHVSSLEGGHVIIIDDVATTGNTLYAAKKACASAGAASISLVAFAH